MNFLSRILAVPLVAVLVLAAFWVGGGLISNDFAVSMVLTAVILGGLFLALYLFTRAQPGFRIPVLGTFLIVSGVVGGVLAWNTFRDEEVNEQVVVGVAQSQAAENEGGAAGEGSEPAGNVQLRSGMFEDVAHPGEGTAAVVELPGGERKLTLTDFETDNGPDLFVYLVAGSPEEAEDADDFVDLGGLKGNVGNQQYEIPRDVDLNRYSNVVVWCRAFSVPFTKAALRES